MAEQDDPCQDITASLHDDVPIKVSPSSDSSSPTSKSSPTTTNNNNNNNLTDTPSSLPPPETSFAAPLLEGWPPTATPAISESVSTPTILVQAPDLASTSAMEEDVIMAEPVINQNEVIMTDSVPDLTISTDDATLSMDSLPDVAAAERGNEEEAPTRTTKIVLKTTVNLPPATDSLDINSGNNTVDSSMPSPDPPVPALASPQIIAARTNSTLPSRTTSTNDNGTNENSLNSIINTRSNSQHLDGTTSATSISGMPKEAPPHGAPTRKFLNENVTGVLLDGLKIIAKDRYVNNATFRYETELHKLMKFTRPSNPLRALGEFLIQRSKEINQSSDCRKS